MTTATKPSINDRFMEFHEANLHVYSGLRRLALEAKRSHHKYGIEELYGILRWQRAVQTSGEEYKLNDHYTSRYARMLMQLNEELDGFFETRRLKGDEPDYRSLYYSHGVRRPEPKTSLF